ncbi:hypothetical protein D3C78_1941640 [compost metagenome]
MGGKYINAIPPSHVAESFIVIDENIGGIAECSAVATIICDSVIVSNDSIYHDLIGIVC